MPATALSNGLSIDRFIPPQLRHMFFRNPTATAKYRIGNGLDPYGFTTDGLVGYFPLWALKDSGFRSVDAYKNTTSVTGALWQPDGRLFDGTDDEISGVSPFGNVDFKNQAFTIEVWAKLDSSKSAHVLAFLTPATAANFAITLFYFTAGDNIDIGFNRADRGTTDRISIRAGGQEALIKDKWCHYLFTHNGGGTPSTTATLTHLNGSLVSTIESFGTFGGQLANKFYIGRDVEGAGGVFFKGNTGEVRFYNRVLSPSEIHQNYLLTRWRYQ